jgi:prepilin-type N-terminal cleavage/methylation domain-containing protein
MRKAFTLIEILVVISVIGLLLGILVPVLSRAEELAKVTVVNAELRQIGLALDMYFENNRKYPPTEADCISGSLTEHLYQLPRALVESRYLDRTPEEEAMSTNLEDRFNRGHTYKYRCAGEIIVDRKRISTSIASRLWIPNHFPASSSTDLERGRWYPDNDERKQYKGNYSSYFPRSPVRWVVFSIGPRFSEEWLEEQVGIEGRYPIPKELWYTPKQRRGFIVRMQLKNRNQTGSFEEGL